LRIRSRRCSSSKENASIRFNAGRCPVSDRGLRSQTRRYLRSDVEPTCAAFGALQPSRKGALEKASKHDIQHARQAAGTQLRGSASVGTCQSATNSWECRINKNISDLRPKMSLSEFRTDRHVGEHEPIRCGPLSPGVTDCSTGGYKTRSVAVSDL